MLEVERLLNALCKADVAFVLIGGLAAVARGSAYLTADMDICYQRQPLNYDRLSETLRPFKPYLRGAPPGLPFVLDSETIKAGLNFTLTTEIGDVDILGEVAGLGDFDAVKSNADQMNLYGCPVWVLSVSGLIRCKEVAGRPKDLRVLPELHALLALQEESPAEMSEEFKEHDDDDSDHNDH
jgi:hypothetical protein